MTKEILKRPFLTEKATLMAEKGIYTFEVIASANKLEIADSVAKRFGVVVTKVQTGWLPAKKKSQQTRKGIMKGQQAARKKAIVTLKKGDSIDLFAPVEAKEANVI